jgi:hypothetical protein
MFDNFKPSVTFGIISNIIAIIIGLITLWAGITSHIKDITISQTKTIATIIANDLRTRLNLYESYILELEESGKPVPTLLIYNIKSLEDQLEDLKGWDND